MPDSLVSPSKTDTENPLLLRNQLCHSLYSATNAVIRAYKPLLEPLDLTYAQYLVMLALWEQDAVPIKQLVEATRLDPGTLTPILKRLEQKGLIARQRSREDERQWLMTLTDAGREMRRQAEDIPVQLFCMTSLTLEQAQAMKQAAEQLYNDVLQQESSRTGR